MTFGLYCYCSNVFGHLQLMSKMAPMVGRDITEQHFMPRFLEMCTDALFHVRKVVWWSRRYDGLGNNTLLICVQVLNYFL